MLTLLLLQGTTRMKGRFFTFTFIIAFFFPAVLTAACVVSLCNLLLLSRHNLCRSAVEAWLTVLRQTKVPLQQRTTATTKCFADIAEAISIQEVCM
jgi:hypothetical protein